MSNISWFAIKTRPGTQRTAKPRFNETWERKGETIIERSLRDEGFHVYMPSMRKDIRHHRTKEIITRRFPLLTGYAFVGGDRETNFYALRDCDGVSDILGIGGNPYPIADATIRMFMTAEEEMQYDDTMQAKIHRRERAATVKADLALRFPTGSKFEVKEGPFAGFHGEVTSVHGRACVKAMMNIFGGLVPTEFTSEQIEKVA
jgi:transcription antitermination factor NusG